MGVADPPDPGLPGTTPGADAGPDRRAIEEAVRQMPVGVVVTDTQGRVVLSNEVADALIGPPAGDGPDAAIYTLQRPDGTPCEWESMPPAQALRTGEQVHGREAVVVDPQGRRRVLSVSAAPIHADDGSVVLAVAVLRDVTEQRATENQRSTLHLRLVRLQAITASLAATRTPEQVLDVVLSQVVKGVGAEAASAALLDEDGRTLEVAAAVGYGPSAMERYRRFDLDTPEPLAEAARSGEPVVASPSDDADNADDQRTGSLVALPLRTEDHTLGALGLTFTPPHPFDDSEVAFLTAVATQCAQALDRARVYKKEAAARAQAERAQARLSFLAEVSDVLASTLDPHRTMTYVAELAVPRLGDWCLVTLRDSDGRITTHAVAHVDPAKARAIRELVERWPPEPDAAIGSGAVLRTGRAALYRHISDDLLREQATGPEHLEALRRLGLQSSMIVPLRARGRILGTLTIANGTGRRADETDLALAEEAATRAAVAIDNAQMFAERSHASRSLQASLLPPRLPEVPGLDVGAAYLPAGSGVDVGGDFYDMVELEQGRWLLVVGDVCGKGIDAASVTGLARHTIRAVASAADAPSRTLRQLNRALRRAALERGEDEMDVPFATVCAVVVEPQPDGTRITACSAGHPLPLALRQDGSVEEVAEPGMALGIFDDPDLTDVTFMLAPGEVLVCLTDGILERRDGHRYFEDEIGAAIARAADLDAHGIAARLRAEAEAFSPDAPADDMAVLVLRVPRQPHTG